MNIRHIDSKRLQFIQKDFFDVEAMRLAPFPPSIVEVFITVTARSRRWLRLRVQTPQHSSSINTSFSNPSHTTTFAVSLDCSINTQSFHCNEYIVDRVFTTSLKLAVVISSFLRSQTLLTLAFSFSCFLFFFKMRSQFLSLAATVLVFSRLVQGQTSTDCNPLTNTSTSSPLP
jgi:hypothetical protein